MIVKIEMNIKNEIIPHSKVSSILTKDLIKLSDLVRKPYSSVYY